LTNYTTSGDIKKKKNAFIYERRKYIPHDDVFNVIDTEEKAYWLGFLWAEASTWSNNNIYVGQHTRDLQHIEKLRYFFYGTDDKSIFQYKDRETCLLTINSKQIVDDLERLGFRDKTFPPMLDSVKRHFIRGEFDGDGCWGNESYRRLIMTFSGKYNLLSSMRDIIVSDCDVEWRNVRMDKRTERTSYLTFRKPEDVRKILFYFYKDATIYMYRRWEKICEIIDNFYLTIIRFREFTDSNTYKRICLESDKFYGA